MRGDGPVLLATGPRCPPAPFTSAALFVRAWVMSLIRLGGEHEPHNLAACGVPPPPRGFRRPRGDTGSGEGERGREGDREGERGTYGGRGGEREREGGREEGSSAALEP